MDMAVQPEEQHRQTGIFQHLHPQARLLFARDACLPMRSAYAQCNACQDACPSGVLNLRPESLELSDGCLNCGRCAAVCPTGALAASGFDDMCLRHESSADVEVECWKVPGNSVGRNAVRVPCTGGVSTGQWLALHAQARGRAVRVVDRGWCTGCTAGGTRHPARTPVERVNAYLEEMGLPADRWIAFDRRTLPPSRMPESIPDTLDVSAISRRTFFGNLAGRIADRARSVQGAREAQDNPRPARESLQSSRPVERDRTLLALHAIAARESRPLPASAFPALQVSDACRNHNVCASTCPTGAIVRYEDETAAGIAFDSSDCIACGDCERVCPEHAISLLPRGNGDIPKSTARLTRFDQRECDACGSHFFATSAETFCPGCAKSRHFVHSAFRQLFGGPA
jgi:ferredoxin